MKSIFIIILLFLSFSSFSQNDYDSLRKYSYYIVGNYENLDDSGNLVSTGKITGTGYFMRYNQKIFFITAKHVVIGTDEACQKMIPTTDSGMMKITLVNDAGIMQPEFISLNVKKFRETAACDFLQVTPDVTAYEISNPENYTIYSIEKFLPSYLPAERGQIITFGYRDSLDISTGSMVSRESISMISNIYDVYANYKFYRGDQNGVDSINYLVEVRDPLFSFRELKGHSGSPAFIKDTKRNRYVFLGTLVGMNYVHNNLSFAKPKILWQILMIPNSQS